MTTYNKLLVLLVVFFPLCSNVASGQTMDVPRDQPTVEATKIPQNRSRAKTVLINIAGAVLEVLCIETGRCAPIPNSRTEPPEPTPQGFDRRGTAGVPTLSRAPTPIPDNSGPVRASHLNFSFTIPSGWQRYDNVSSVTLARQDQYTSGNLLNGVILGLYDVSTSNFEKGAARYASDLISQNKYLKPVTFPENTVVDGVSCIVNRLAGRSPKSGYDEQVVVYACKRSPIKMFYLVTVNSGPNSTQFDQYNESIARSLSFR